MVTVSALTPQGGMGLSPGRCSAAKKKKKKRFEGTKECAGILR